MQNFQVTISLANKGMLKGEQYDFFTITNYNTCKPLQASFTISIMSTKVVRIDSHRMQFHITIQFRDLGA